MEKEQSKESLPYWYETQEWKDFSKLAHKNFGGKPSMENRITRLEQILGNLYNKNGKGTI